MRKKQNREQKYSRKNLLVDQMKTITKYFKVIKTNFKMIDTMNEKINQFRTKVIKKRFDD